MISIKDIRTNSQNIEKALRSNCYDGSMNDIISLDENFRKVTHSLEQLRAKKNTVSEQVARAKRSGENSNEKIWNARRRS